MKNKTILLGLAGCALGLSACAGGASDEHYSEYTAPYSQSRTATHKVETAPVVPVAEKTEVIKKYEPAPQKAEYVFKKAVTK